MNNNRGFTLIELMITLAIVAIIAVIAVPSYLNYTKKAHYSEIVRSTGPYVIGVAECFHRTGTFTGCHGGVEGIPNDITNTTESIANLIVRNGQITVTPEALHGISPEDTYILTPSEQDSMISWQCSGGGVSKGLTK